MKPTDCLVCAAPSLASVNLDLAAGLPAAEVARKYALSVYAVRRHRTNHALRQLTETELPTARAALEAADAEPTTSLRETDTYLLALRGLFARVREPDLKHRIAGTARSFIELRARLTGELKAADTVAVAVDARQVTVRYVGSDWRKPAPEVQAAEPSGTSNGDPNV